MKKDVRFLGVDDSPFQFKDETVRVVGVVSRGPSYVEGVLSTTVKVDGKDATEKLQALIGSTRFRPMLRAVFLNGITLGGFNLVDVDALWDAVRVPIVCVVRDEPDLARSKAALEKHFADAKERLEVWKRLKPDPIINGRFTVWCSWRGVEREAVRELLEASTVRGAIPEPLRLAHVIASGIARGESRGPV